MDAKSVIKYSILIKQYLKSDIEDIFFNDDTIDIVGDVVLDTLTTSLPIISDGDDSFLSIPFGKIIGSFSVVSDSFQKLSLTSFRNFPKEVTKNLNVNGCHFKNFEYFPKSIGGNILLCNNDLNTLKGMNIEKCYGDFNISLNDIRSLEGCPKDIEGDFNCSHNRIKDFNYVPSYVGGAFLCTNLMSDTDIDVLGLNNIKFGNKEAVINLYRYDNYLNFDKLKKSLQKRITKW